MPGICTFKVAEVRRLYEHAKKCTYHRPSMIHAHDGRYYPGGVPLNEFGRRVNKDEWPCPNQIDQKLVPACLNLVGEVGIFLISNGEPGLLVEGEMKRHFVSYANESSPRSGRGDWHITKSQIFGSQDAVRNLPVEMFDKVMMLPDEATFQISIDADRITILDEGIESTDETRKNMGNVIYFPRKILSPSLNFQQYEELSA